MLETGIDSNVRTLTAFQGYYLRIGMQVALRKQALFYVAPFLRNSSEEARIVPMPCFSGGVTLATAE